MAFHILIPFSKILAQDSWSHNLWYRLWIMVYNLLFWKLGLSHLLDLRQRNWNLHNPLFHRISSYINQDLGFDAFLLVYLWHRLSNFNKPLSYHPSSKILIGAFHTHNPWYQYSSRSYNRLFCTMEFWQLSDSRQRNWNPHNL